MVFSSIVFLCTFLAGVFLLYTVVPSLKAKNALLIIASLTFYAYGEPVYVFLMLGSSLMNYLCALWISKTPKHAEGKNRFAVIMAIVANLGLLVVFKYSGMIVDTCNTAFGTSLPVPAIALPIGISFFTFQALSYVIDVYRGAVAVQRNFFYVLLYISFFPQLIAGPIVKYRDIEEMIVGRRQSVENIAHGLRRFICGLAKKVLIGCRCHVLDPFLRVVHSDRMARGHRLYLPDLLRLQRLFRHGARPRDDVRVQVQGELQLPL